MCISELTKSHISLSRKKYTNVARYIAGKVIRLAVVQAPIASEVINSDDISLILNMRE